MTEETPDNAARAPVHRYEIYADRSADGGVCLETDLDNEGEWVRYEAHAATVTALEAEVADLKASLDRLSGMKFSDRMHAALVSRADVAERRVADLEGVLASVIADASWRTSDNTLWPRLVKAMQNTGAGAK